MSGRDWWWSGARDAHHTGGVGAGKRAVRVALFVLGGALVGAAACVVAVLVSAMSVAAESAEAQLLRLDALRAEVGALPGGIVAGWEDAPVDDRVSWDRVQSIATHNSYAVAPNGVQSFVLDVVRPGESARLAYSHEPLWVQLERGVRSFELDVRAHADGALRLTHVPLLANGSHSPDFRLALEEVALWSAAHPGHLPLTLLLEFKHDYGFLDPSLVGWSAESVLLVEGAVSEAFGDRLVTPADVGSEWPLVGALRDRVMVVMHPDAGVEAVYAAAPARGGVMFVAGDAGAAGPGASVSRGPGFVVLNEPDAASISALVDAGVVVRTRADADLVVDAARSRVALRSGAQLISTDFAAPVPGVVAVSFEGGVLSRVDPERMPSAAELRRVSAELWVGAASVRELAGSVVMATVQGVNAESLRSVMERTGLGGFILMGANVPGSPAKLRALTDALTLNEALPPLIAIDEEGGWVKRLPWDGFAGANTLRSLPVKATSSAFAGRAKLLAAAGVNTNFGVVADVTADRGSFIFWRTLGDSGRAAAPRVAAAVAAENGVVLSTLKHFPGHGAAPGDSHFTVPSTGRSLDAWRSRDALPFAAGIEAGAELLMFGHLAYTSVSSKPATLAPEWYEIARDELGFTGVAITDDLSMLKATGLKKYQDVAGLVVESLKAGADMALVVAGMDAKQITRIVDRVAEAAESGDLPMERLQEAATRVAELRLLLAERAAGAVER